MKYLIGTDRLVLRDLEPRDEDTLAAMLADEEVMRWIGPGGRRCRETGDRARARALRGARLGRVGDDGTRLRPHDRPLRTDPLARYRRKGRARVFLHPRPRRVGQGVRHRGGGRGPRCRAHDPTRPRLIDTRTTPRRSESRTRSA